VKTKRFERLRFLFSVPYGTEISLEELATFVCNTTGRSTCGLQSRTKEVRNKPVYKFLRVNKSRNKLYKFIPYELESQKEENRLRLVEAVTAFRQAAALLIRQEFQKSLDDAKFAHFENLKDFNAHFRTAFIAAGVLKSSGSYDQYHSVIQTALSEYSEDSFVRCRNLEKDLKLLYLNPTDKLLLRPNLPDIPRRIDFRQRDEMIQKLRYRATHQINI
jgi:hypothetical protein